AEVWLFRLRQQGPRRVQEILLRGTQAVEDHGDGYSDEHPQNRAGCYAGGGDKRRLGDALGGQAHGPDGEARPVGEADEGGALEAEAVEDVLYPEGVAIPPRRGASLRAQAGLSHDIGRVEAVSPRQRQE